MLKCLKLFWRVEHQAYYLNFTKLVSPKATGYAEAEAPHTINGVRGTLVVSWMPDEA